MDSRKVIIWANCQGDAIRFILSRYFSNITNYYNYEFIRNNIPIPKELLEADIIIYQNYSSFTETIYNINLILNSLPIECLKISIPFLQSDIYFPFDNKEHKNNFKSKNKLKYYGDFYYGISVINDLIDDENNINNDEFIINKVFDDNFIKNDEIEHYFNKNLEYLKNKILNSNVKKLYQFILDNYKYVRLFHNRNHPTGILLEQLIIEILNNLNLNHYFSLNDKLVLDNILKDWIVPILPCVSKYHQLTFDTNICFSKYDNEIINIESYIKKYILSIKNT